MRALAREIGPFNAAVGHSFGAAAVTLAIDEGLDVARAVLIAPPLGPTYFVERMCRFLRVPRERTAGIETELMRMVGRPMADLDADRVAARLAQPALILHDPNDDEVPFAHGAAIARAWAGSTIVPATGEGHYRILKSPATIGRTLGFLVS